MHPSMFLSSSFGFTDLLSYSPNDICQYDMYTSEIVGDAQRNPVAGADATENPGGYSVVTSETAESGVQTRTRINALHPDSVYMAIFQMPAVAVDNRMIIGFADSFDDTPNNALYLKIAGQQVFGRNSSDGEFADTPVIATLSPELFYTAFAILNKDTSLMSYYVYDSGGALLGTQALEDNIPELSGLTYGGIKHYAAAGVHTVGQAFRLAHRIGGPDAPLQRFSGNYAIWK